MPRAYFSLADKDVFAGTPMAAWLHSPALQALMREVFIAVFGKPPRSPRPYPVLRVVHGDSEQRRAHRYHFDAYRLTVLIPLVIPEGSGANGDLILFPRARRMTSSALWNASQKAVLQNPLVWSLIRRPTLRAALRGRRVILRPGSLYVFDGFTTYHANDCCASDRIRATLLLHLDDPFEENEFLAWIRRWRLAYERRQRARLVAP